VGFALSIVAAAIGMTFAAPSNFGRSEAASPTPVATVAPLVAGYQAAPLSANTPAALSASSTQGAATLVALATTVVLLAIFVILFSYRPRPGGVRASHR
jgi:hypothetical protein